MIQPTPNKPYAIRCVHFDGSCRAGKCAIGEFGGTPTCEQCDGCNKREWPNPGPARMPKTSNTAGAGPGDIVAIVLKQMGVKSAGCVKCAMMRKRMNEWKWLGCLWNMKTIVAWFADRARDEGLTADPNNVRALIKAAFKQMRSARPRRIIINCDSHGFGDAIVMAWIAEGAKTSKPIALHATGAKRDLLEMLGQTVVNDPARAKETFDAYYHQELSVERGSVQRVVSRARAMGIQSDPARPSPIRIPKKNLDWAKTLDIGKPIVALFPQVEFTCRAWPACHWIDLAWSLDAAGVRSIVFLKDEDQRFTNTPFWIYGHSWIDLAAACLQAKLVIANDSGPAHLAGTLNVPTLALLGPTKPTALNHMPSVECIATDQVGCVGCHWGKPFRAACDQGCRALYAITPEMIVAKVMEKLK